MNDLVAPAYPLFPPGTSLTSPLGGGLTGQVVEDLGQRIVDGRLPEGEALIAERVGESFRVSRGVVREAFRTLSSLGLIEARQRVGTHVTPRERWNMLHPAVILWRGRGPDYLVQQKELLEVRLGVEPVAAALAAERAAVGDLARLSELAAEMRDCLERGDMPGHFRADSAFHRWILERSANSVLARLAGTVEAALYVRGVSPRPGLTNVHLESIGWHEAVALAIGHRDAAGASDAAAAIITHTLAEFGREVAWA
ncbi:MAG: FCD domain-containing protein [Propionibacteriaceae bacterium]|jgi:DNA-binding FadR family transcriptional regulator|nr:FCD domain-containing protein [Propionibacteriaceae bacterium]